MFVCLSSFYRPHDICPLCGAASEWPRAGSAVAGGPARAGKRMHSDLARARARMPYNFSTKKSLRWCLSKTKPYARACCRIRDCRDFQQNGKRKPTCHFPSSVYSLPSLGVFSFRIVLNCILHKSSLLAPMESRRSRRPTFTAEERLERRREQDRRRHAERRARERREQTLARMDVDRLRSSQARASKTLLQRLQSWLFMETKLCRLRHLNGESFRSVRQVISCCFTPRNFSLSESYGVLISSSNRVHGPRNCSQEGSRTASRFAIQVDRDGRSNCSQLGSRPSPANKPCPRRGDSRRSSGQTRRSSASDGCRKGRWETWSCWQCGCFHPQTLWWYSSSALIVPVGLLVWWDAAHRFLPVFISFTTGLRAYIHTFMTIIFPNAVSHSLLSIIFNTACLHVT